MTRIRLNMIVRDESARIGRCLRATLPFVDSYAILDTGSTDETPAIIRGIAGELKKDGRVGHASFVDFSQARNTALDLALEDDAFDYLLLVDADMELRVEDPTALDALDAPFYSIVSFIPGSLSHAFPRLLRRDVARTARYHDETHEYLRANGRDLFGGPEVPGLTIVDHADGASHAVKFERDEKLLRRALERDPGNTRATFYLARTLDCVGRWAEAAGAYEKRAAMGGFEEEAWYAEYRRAHCLSMAGDERFAHAALMALKRRPHRAEPLHVLAEHYRLKAEAPRVAALLADVGRRFERPTEETLFVDEGVYAWGFDQILGISGYYEPSLREEARRACFRLAVDRSVPEHVRGTARRNSPYHARSARETFGDGVEVSEIDISGARDEVWSPTNPSIARGPDGRLLTTLRLVNYEAGGYTVRTGDGRVRTRNLLVDLDDELVPVGEPREMLDRTNDHVCERSYVLGFEDLRLFYWRGRLWASATALDRNHEQRAEILLLELDDEHHVVRAYPQRAFEGHLHQKNWMPLVLGEELFFVYKVDPAVVLRMDPETLEAREHARPQSSERFELSMLRGSSQVVPWEDGFLCVTHEAYDYRDEYGRRRRYLHRFVEIDSDLSVRRITDPFHITKPGIEFAAGLARVGGALVVSFGVDDARAMLMTVPADDVADRLFSTPKGA